MIFLLEPLFFDMAKCQSCMLCFVFQLLETVFGSKWNSQSRYHQCHYLCVKEFGWSIHSMGVYARELGYIETKVGLTFSRYVYIKLCFKSQMEHRILTYDKTGITLKNILMKMVLLWWIQLSSFFVVHKYMWIFDKDVILNCWVKKTKVGSPVAVNLSNKYRNDIISVKEYYSSYLNKIIMYTGVLQVWQWVL